MAPASASDVKIEVRRSGALVVVALTGVLDLMTCQPVAELLDWTLVQDSQRTVLDLRSLEAIDHAGVHTLLVAYLRASDQFDEFLIVAGPESVQRVIDRIHGPFQYIPHALLPRFAASANRMHLIPDPGPRGRVRARRAIADRARRLREARR